MIQVDLETDPPKDKRRVIVVGPAYPLLGLLETPFGLVEFSSSATSFNASTACTGTIKFEAQKGSDLPDPSRHLSAGLGWRGKIDLEDRSFPEPLSPKEELDVVQKLSSMLNVMNMKSLKPLNTPAGPAKKGRGGKVKRW